MSAEGDATTARQPAYGSIDREYALRLATTAPDDDGPVWMVNLMQYRDRAEYADGTDHGLTGREADDRYAPLGPLGAIGAEVVFVGEVEDQLLGETPRWDRIGVVRYPSRRSFIEMQQRPDFQELHVHKEAGMAATIVMGCQPIIAPMADAEDQLVDWADVPHPPTPDDGEVVVLHVLRFVPDANGEHAASTPDEMAEYQVAAGAVAVPHGVRIDGWFEVEGTIIGDGRSWDQVRFNRFPSKAAFMAVVTDPARLDAQHTHREAAIEDTYALIVRPVINRLAERGESPGPS